MVCNDWQWRNINHTVSNKIWKFDGWKYDIDCQGKPLNIMSLVLEPQLSEPLKFWVMKENANWLIGLSLFVVYTF